MNNQINLKLALLKQMVKDANGQINSDIIKLVEEITTSKETSSVNKAQEALELINRGFNSQQIVDTFSNTPQPPIALSIASNVFSSLLAPIKMSFAREIPKYINSISFDKTIRRKIFRLLPSSTLRTISNGRIQSFNFNSLSSGERDEVEEWIINPEYKQLLVNGYKPRDDREYRELVRLLNSGQISGDAEFKDNPFLGFYLQQQQFRKYLRVGTPESDYTKNVLNEYIVDPIPHENVSVKITEQAGIMKEVFRNVRTELQQYPYGMKIDLNGTINTNFNLDTIPQIPETNQPNWNISYIENKNNRTYLLKINKNFQHSSAYGLVPFSSSLSLTGELEPASNEANSSDDSGLNSAAQEREQELSITQEQCDPNNNDELAAAIFLDNVGDIFSPNVDADYIAEQGQSLNNDEKQVFNNYLKESFNNIMTSFVKNSFEGLINNRLLRNFDPTAGLNLNAFDEDPSTRNTLIVLSLLNFLPETPQYLVDCDKKIHPLNIDEILSLMQKKFNEIGSSNRQVIDSTEAVPSDPVGQSVSMASTLLLFRIMTLEYLLKNIVVFDELEYDKALTQSHITKEYLSIEIKKQLEDLRIYRRVERAISNNYDFFKSNKIIKNEDETVSSIRINSLVNGNSFSPPSPKFKNLVSAMLRKNVGFLKNLIGFNNSQQNNSGKAVDKLLKSSKIYDVFSANNDLVPLTEEQILVDTRIKNCDIRRFSDKYKENTNNEEQQFFIFERFVKFKGFKTNIFRNQQEDYWKVERLLKIAGITNDGILSFQEFSSFINDFILERKLLSTDDFDFYESLTQEATFIYDRINFLCNNKNFNISSLTEEEISTINSNLQYFFEPFEIGIRKSLVWKSFDIIDTNDQSGRERISQQVFNRKLFFKLTNRLENNVSNKFILPNRKFKDRAYCFVDYDPEVFTEDGNKTQARIYNSIVIDEFLQKYNFSEIKLFENIKKFKNSLKLVNSNVEVNFNTWVSRRYIDPSDIITFDDSVISIYKNLENFLKKEKNTLLQGLLSKPDIQLLTKKSMSSDKIINLMSFYTDCGMSNKQIQTLFRGTKDNIRKLLLSSETLDGYADPPVSQDENYTRDMNNVGNPNPDFNLDLLWFLITTPILILKGLAQTIDPNIAIASKIVDAAAAGLLFPKLNDRNQPVGYPGDPVILPTFLVSMLLLPVNILLPFTPPIAIGPPVTPLGMVYWGLEPLLWQFPYFTKLASESSAAQSLSSNPEYGNLLISVVVEPYFVCNRDQDENP